MTQSETPLTFEHVSAGIAQVRSGVRDLRNWRRERRQEQRRQLKRKCRTCCRGCCCACCCAKPDWCKNLGDASFLYPLKGVYYLATHSYLHPLVRSRIVPAAIISAIVLANLFLWTYLPQVALLAVFHGRRGALLNAAFLVLEEGATVTALLFEAFFVDHTLLDVFDATLVAEGCAALVATGRPVVGIETSDDSEPYSVAYPSDMTPRERLGPPSRSMDIYSPFSMRQIVEFVLLLPLNFVPWIGVPLFLWLTGYRAGPLQHHRYFALLGFRKREKSAAVKSRRLGYTGFGVTALILQLVPLLSMFFLLSTAAGSALWAARLERQRLEDAGTWNGAGYGYADRDGVYDDDATEYDEEERLVSRPGQQSSQAFPPSARGSVPGRARDLDTPASGRTPATTAYAPSEAGTSTIAGKPGRTDPDRDDGEDAQEDPPPPYSIEEGSRR